MSLQEYLRKRRHGRTPEPLETPEPTTSDRRRFCLQRHQASRLHYDLRLEMGGVLKSWAVPKGPSLTPLLKRLAVPLSLRRFPDGVEGADFFQKHPPAGTPDWVRTAPTEHGLALLADDFATLVFLANLAFVEVHATLSRLPTLSTPDGFLLDLDPQDAPFPLVRKVAAASGEILRELGWSGYLKTSGSRGIHIFVPLAPEYSFEQSRMVASLVAEILSRRLKGQVTLERVPAKRPRGTVYVDAPQNRSAATMACAYSARATPSATFSMPLAWEELEKDVTPLDFSIAKLPARLSDTARLWSMRPSPEQRIQEALLGLEEMLR